MRRIWVAVALLLICGVLSVIEYVTIHNNCDYLTSSLNKAEEYISIKEYKKAVSFLEKTQQEWIKFSLPIFQILCIMQRHINMFHLWKKVQMKQLRIMYLE